MDSRLGQRQGPSNSRDTYAPEHPASCGWWPWRVIGCGADDAANTDSIVGYSRSRSTVPAPPKRGFFSRRPARAGGDIRQAPAENGHHGRCGAYGAEYRVDAASSPGLGVVDGGVPARAGRGSRRFDLGRSGIPPTGGASPRSTGPEPCARPAVARCADPGFPARLGRPNRRACIAEVEVAYVSEYS